MHQQFIILIGIMLLAMGTYLIRYAGLSLANILRSLNNASNFLMMPQQLYCFLLRFSALF
jgi:hypothetical protein